MLQRKCEISCFVKSLKFSVISCRPSHCFTRGTHDQSLVGDVDGSLADLPEFDYFILPDAVQTSSDTVAIVSDAASASAAEAAASAGVAAAARSCALTR